MNVDRTIVEVIAIGDVMLGRGVTDEPGPLEDTAFWLRTPDLTLGNLECVIAPEAAAAPHPDQPDDPTRPIRLQAPPSAVIHLRQAGFDVMGLANNHTLDLGPAGLAETASRLQEAGIATVGAGSDIDAASRPLIREVNGVRLALLAFNAMPDQAGDQSAQSEGWSRADWNPARAVKAVAGASAQADAVIVSVHWGYEYETYVDPAQRNAARALLEAGADLVIGHHPHVVQAFEVTDGRAVAYSLGNFVFDQEQGKTRQGLALRALFDERGLQAVQALPVWAGARPRLMTPEEVESLLTRVRPSRRLGFDCDDRTCHQVEIQQKALERIETRAGLFWGGEIDLTGDGIPEKVRRVSERAIIYREGVEVWRSPPDWRVVDLALGDPNADGRGELLLAIWKQGLDSLETPSPNTVGRERSRPFIVGYRGGIYRTLWGGSAVSEPILEVELGDVDGDGAQELLVLEAGDDGLEHVTVWRWHGWGFSLMWRSPPGQYRDLTLVTNEDSDNLPVLSVIEEP